MIIMYIHGIWSLVDTIINNDWRPPVRNLGFPKNKTVYRQKVKKLRTIEIDENR